MYKRQVGKSYIKEDNIKFLDNEVIPNLIDCRITPPDYKKAAKDFIMPDVTEKLFEIMRKAEADGREIALENPGIKNYIDKLLAFMSSVGAGNDYDLKAKEDWNSSWYYFDGYVLRFDDQMCIRDSFISSSKSMFLIGFTEFSSPHITKTGWTIALKYCFMSIFI